jgi:predicted phosphodiesterase
MRVFTISDLHVDHEQNRHWVGQLSTGEYRDDVLILAGDISDSLARLEWCLASLARRFARVLFVPGNHDLWVLRDAPGLDSLRKFGQVCALAQQCGVGMAPHRAGAVTIVPLLGWYDYSFGAPEPRLRAAWMDYRACRWPAGHGPAEVTDFFLAKNPVALADTDAAMVITFSHFLPRNDLAPPDLAAARRVLDPVMGTSKLDVQLRRLGASIHVYGHSHLNGLRTVDGVRYINNAFGTPRERAASARALLQVY